MIWIIHSKHVQTWVKLYLCFSAFTQTVLGELTIDPLVANFL